MSVDTFKITDTEIWKTANLALRIQLLKEDIQSNPRSIVYKIRLAIAKRAFKWASPEDQWDMMYAEEFMRDPDEGYNAAGSNTVMIIAAPDVDMETEACKLLAIVKR